MFWHTCGETPVRTDCPRRRLCAKVNLLQLATREPPYAFLRYSRTPLGADALRLSSSPVLPEVTYVPAAVVRIAQLESPSPHVRVTFRP